MGNRTAAAAMVVVEGNDVQLTQSVKRELQNYSHKSLVTFPFTTPQRTTYDIQWILDLVTIDLVTILDLVTLLPLTRFLCSKMHRFSDNLANFIVLI